MLRILATAALLSFARPTTGSDLDSGELTEPPRRLQSSYGSVKRLLIPRQQKSALSGDGLLPESQVVAND